MIFCSQYKKNIPGALGRAVKKAKKEHTKEAFLCIKSKEVFLDHLKRTMNNSLYDVFVSK